MYVCVFRVTSYYFQCSCWCFRWTCFSQLGLFDDINEKLKQLPDDKPVQFSAHVGGGYFVSVTKGYKCVDFRKFYMPEGQSEERPTRERITMRLREWDAMRVIVQSINQSYQSLGNAVSCYEGNDHCNQLSALQCTECYPFVDTSSLVVC